MNDVIALLKKLIAIDSVNPSLVPGGAGEEEIAQRIAAELQGFGAAVEIQEIAPKRVNVIGVLEATAPGRSLMLCGHSDTVGVEGMTSPFDPIERDGKLYGRGAQDMKGGVAAILNAARTIAEKNLLRAGRLVIVIVADEEHASIGAERVVKSLRCDAAIVCEPTDLAVGVGHKGFEWVDVETHGVAAHGSRPDDGVDAIVMMGRVLAGIEALDLAFAAAPPHPLLGRPSVHASLIRGGRELSTYPDRCSLSIERRTVEGEREGILLDEVREMIEGELGAGSRELGAARVSRSGFRAPSSALPAEARLTFTRRPYITPESCELLRLLPGPRTALSFWTDAAILGHAGTPSVVFGPGGAGLHGIEEYVRIDEVLTCRDVLVDVATRFCA